MYSKYILQEIITKRTREGHEANSNLPPTVAPIRATNSSNGMFILKTELSASHFSARALRGVVNIKALPTRNAIVGVLNCVFPCQTNKY